MMADLKRRKRRRFQWGIIIALLVGVVLFARPTFHVLHTMWFDVDDMPVTPEGFVNDASRLNLTKVLETWQTPSNPAAAERQLVLLLERAQREGLKVSIAGTQHSMGGHTIYPDGVVIDMLPLRHMDLNEEKNILHVGAGACWWDIIPFLDQEGLSVAIMQSNNSFSVGGSISANCHGWQFGQPPISSSVESIRLLKTDGSIVRCSRTENQELFSLALGGYGLFGIILEVDLRVVRNRRYRLEQVVVPMANALTTLDRKIEDTPGVAMVYARLSIVPNRLFEEVIINLFHEETGDIPKLEDADLSNLRRAMFRGSVDSDYGKELRWNSEAKLQPFLLGKVFSRNQLLNEGVEWYSNRSAESTDVLHEYFVPRERVVAFVDQMRVIISEHHGNLLNVTVRGVDTDEDTFLRYANQPMFAFVMLFNQPRTDVGEARMEALTRELIDAALAHDGRYYLPYRLHATKAQFEKAYPQALHFFERKRFHDPNELLQNEFYVRYGLAR